MNHSLAEGVNRKYQSKSLNYHHSQGFINVCRPDLEPEYTESRQ